MTVDELKEKRIALVGVGTENEVLAAYLTERGVRFSVCDARGDQPASSTTWGESVVSWHLGEEYLDHLDKFELIFRTPGISPLHSALRKAAAAGAEVSSQTRLFFQGCEASILAVTGTKGKGTTVSAIVEMLTESPYERVWLGGNIGAPPIQYVDEVSARDLVVLELSSFQLQDLGMSPHIAVMLNLFDDHLDYHENRAEYLEAKRTICRFQQAEDYLISNGDSPEAMSFQHGSSGRRMTFSIAREVEDGCFVSGGSLWLRLEGEEAEKICGVDDIPLPGDHNLSNVTAASTAAAAAGASIEAIGRGISKISALPHRLQLVGEAGGVAYYNDSLATVPEASLASVRAFVEPLHLIAGGSSKGADFSLFAAGIAAANVKSVALIGDEAERIATALKAASFAGDVRRFDTLEASLRALTAGAQPGEVVLLAPACASFGLFENYAERGRAFNRLVEELQSN